MVICRFFQQGTCRFGSTCRNEHVNNNQYTYQGPAVRPQQQNVVSNDPQHDIAVQVRSILLDMTIANQGKQWLLSCYGPFRGKPNFPTFEDHSFEEIRWMVYNAQKQGKSSDAVIQLYTRMMEEAKQKLSFYQSPTRELIDVIKNIYSTTETAKDTTTNFGNSTSIFSQTNNNNNAPTSNFSNTNSIFNQTNPPPQPPTPQTNQSIFGGSNQQQSNNIFNSAINNQAFPFNSQSNNGFPTAATNQTNNNIFTNNQNTTSTNHVFGQANPKPESTNVFGTTNSPLAQNTNIFTANTVQSNTPLVQNTNVFSGSPTTNSPITNVFSSNSTASSPNTNVFSSNSTASSPNTNVFSSNPTANSPNTNVFGNPTTNSSNIFGSNQLNTFQTQQNSVFAQTSTKSDNIFINNSMVPQQTVFNSPNQTDSSNKQLTNPFATQQTVFSNSTNSMNTAQTHAHIKPERSDYVQIYSKMEDLSETDIKAFQKERFDFGCIPILPPPSSLCYAS